jgi:hypothetical protein
LKRLRIVASTRRAEPRRVVVRVRGRCLAASCECLLADGLVAIVRAADDVESNPLLCGPGCECELVAVD